MHYAYHHVRNRDYMLSRGIGGWSKRTRMFYQERAIKSIEVHCRWNKNQISFCLCVGLMRKVDNNAIGSYRDIRFIYNPNLQYHWKRRWSTVNCLIKIQLIRKVPNWISPSFLLSPPAYQEGNKLKFPSFLPLLSGPFTTGWLRINDHRWLGDCIFGMILLSFTYPGPHHLIEFSWTRPWNYKSGGQCVWPTRFRQSLILRKPKSRHATWSTGRSRLLGIVRRMVQVQL